MLSRRARYLGAVAVIAIAAGLGSWRLLSSPQARDAPTTITVSAATIGRPIPPSFVGLSLEFPAVPAYAGGDPIAVNPLFIRLVRTLTPGQAPLLRIGGDSTDATWWPTPGVGAPKPGAYRLNQAWLNDAHALAAALGARLILGVNLAGGSPQTAAAEAGAFLQGIGRRYIDAFEIGNEPDLYGRDPSYREADGRTVLARSGGYSPSQFIDEFTRWRRALGRLPVAGPAFAWLQWMNKGLSPFLSAEPGLALVTFHRYPLRRCSQSASSPLRASISNLLSDASSGGLARSVAGYAAAAHARGSKFQLDELNSVSCHGQSGVSDTFAAALWALNTMFNLAEVGVDGVAIHTFPGASYELFSFRRSGGHWFASVKPEYYGLQMFAQAAPPGARLERVSQPSGPLRAWAARAPDGTTRVVLINEDPARGRQLELKPPGPAGVANVSMLEAPSGRATDGVSLGGQSFGTETASAELQGNRTRVSLVPGGGEYGVALPPASAMMVTLSPALRPRPPSS
jgi:hypothetical protein